MLKKLSYPHGYFRAFHCDPVPTSMDLYIDNKCVETDLLYGDFSYYKPLTSGEHLMSIRPFENKEKTLAEKNVFIEENKIYTLIIVPCAKDCAGMLLYLIEDTIRPIPTDCCMVRFGNFCRRFDLIDITLTQTSPIHRKLSCYELGPYMALAPGHYELAITPLHLDPLPSLELDLKPYRFYSLYTRGNEDFDTLLSIDGNSYLSF